jgi:hypothetical protein
LKYSTQIRHEFVEYIPSQLEEGVIYISIPFATAAHKCGCGCGKEVVTPLSPTDWKITFDGVSVSLHPSIGNWDFECESHYFIQNSRVKWAGKMSRQEIEMGRKFDRVAKQQYYQNPDKPITPQQNAALLKAVNASDAAKKIGFWRQIKNWLNN